MGAIFELLVQLLAGVGLVWVGDKVLPDKTTGITPMGTTSTGIASWGPIKIAVFVILMAVGVLIAVFIGKKLHLFKHRR